MKENLMTFLDENTRDYADMAKDIWDRPETALHETYAAKRQSEFLKSRGFRISSVRGVPTAFVAEYGSGSPIIGILGEYDALPDMSQQVCTVRKPLDTDAPGHACGHNLIGTAGVAAVDALREIYGRENLRGTIRYYGCPAEERYSGKILMQKERVFDDLDIAIIWHPQDITGISCKNYYSGLTMMKVEFSGETGHSVAAKNYGGSALQAANLMINGINAMREYIWDYHRLHYYMSDTGKTANLLPKKTSVYCETRAADVDVLLKIKERRTEIAEGCAKIAGTDFTIEMEEELYSDKENPVIIEVLKHNLQLLPRPEYTDDEKEFVIKLAETLPKGAEKKVASFYNIDREQIEDHLHMGLVQKDDLIYLPADDAGNVSQEVPFGTFLVSLPPVGMPMHCWQVTALAGSSIGSKCMMRAAKVMAGAVYDFLTDEKLVQKAAEEFDQ